VAKAPPAAANGTTNGKSPRPIERKTPPPAANKPAAAQVGSDDQDEGSDAKPPAPPSPSGGTNGTNGTPRGRTGASGSRPPKRDRKGR
jgi:hypothetical protein